MKIVRAFIVVLLIFTFLLAAAGCSAGDSKDGYFDGGELGGVYPSAPSGSDEDGAVSGKADGEDSWGDGNYPAGLLTASEWNDNKYFGDYVELFKKAQGDGDVGGKFSVFSTDTWGFDVKNRVTVSVVRDSLPVSGAVVECKNADGAVEFRGRTGADGTAYLFPNAKSGTVVIRSGEESAEADFDSENRALTVSLGEKTETKQNKIQIMLVIDITGSMGDEHQYLTSELSDVVNRVAAENKDTKIELALLFYRDNDDIEKFVYYDFTEVTDSEGLDSVIKNLSFQSASGGGDYPEAVDEALDMAVKKQWDDGTATKLIFHLLDAPAHDKEGNKQLYSSAVLSAAQKGIKICPILASGADTLCEYIVRQAAVYTGGSFIFITDHSGIGGEHLDPNLPNAVIERLNDLLVRVISGYHTGEMGPPIPYTTPSAS